jgi:hypothetical protein
VVGAVVGDVVAAGAQAAKTMERATRTAKTRRMDFIFGSPHKIETSSHDEISITILVYFEKERVG